MKEQPLVINTVVKLDFIDSLKCLFGRCIKITTTVNVLSDQPIEHYNAYSATMIESSSTYFVKQDKPRFGYISKSNEPAVNVIS